MKERPILFSAPMVRAILEGRKTQTRRVMKVQPPDEHYQIGTLVSSTAREDKPNYGAQHWIRPGIDMKQPYFRCPFGLNGDLLWVRETWRGQWEETTCFNFHVDYAADGSEMFVDAPADYVLPKVGTKTTNYITPYFMPRWASRITLEITAVRVQQLKEISEADARAEGVELLKTNCDGECGQTPCGITRQPFIRLWDSINTARGYGWDKNPWVWVLTFRRAVSGAALNAEGGAL